MLEHMPTGSGGPSRKIEITTIVVIGLASLALVSLYSEAAGTIGSWLSGTLRYIFGQLAAVPPLFLGVMAILSIRKNPPKALVRKGIAAAIFFLMIVAAWHMLNGRPVGLVWQDIRAFAPSEPGAGIIGALFTYALLAAFERNGSIVILIVTGLVAISLFLDSPLSRFVAVVSQGTAHLLTNARRVITDFFRGARSDVSDLMGALRDRWVLFRQGRPAAPREKQDKHAAKGAGTKKTPFLAKVKALPLWERLTQRRYRTEERDWAIDRPEFRPSRAQSDEAPVASEAEAQMAATVKHAPAVVETPNAPEENSVPQPKVEPGGAELAHAENKLTVVEKPSVPQRSKKPGRKRKEAVASPQTKATARDQAVQDKAVPEDDTNQAKRPTFRLPPTALLDRPRGARNARYGEGDGQAALLEETLASFGIEAKVVQVDHGPVVTRYEVQPPPGIKVNRITSLADDISLALAAAGIRIEAPVPGKPVVGIEVPNRETSMVYLRDVVESDEFQKSSSRLVMALGKDIAGKPVVADLRKLLHILIAGATGSGKSVCINTIVASILYKALPHEVKLLMIDPKRVELAAYDGIPHLVSPVVTDPKQAAGALKWAVREMENRYNLFSEAGVRNIDGYNRYVEAVREGAESDDEAMGAEEKASLPQFMPFIVIIIDELADLMMVASQDVEESIARLAQMARAAGIHLIVATQRPSVDVITGLIKANVPSRVSFAVASSHDSRTILDMVGAERLIGKGDMLFYPTGSNKPWRAQGAFISDREVHDLVEFWKNQGEPEYREEVVTQATTVAGADEADDELFDDAVQLVIDSQNASISMLQRRFRIGYARAARLIDIMELQGIIGPYQGSRPREVLWTSYEEE